MTLDAVARAPFVDTLLLLGLPASGKSVLGRILTGDHARVPDLGVRFGPAVHLDDFPYVRLMWRVCEVAARRHEPIFLEPDGLLFKDPREWGTLIHLLNDDYASLRSAVAVAPEAPVDWIVDRVERAHVRAGMPPSLSGLESVARKEIAQAVEDDAAAIFNATAVRRRTPGATVVMEFSRGGPDGAELPLAAPYGYAHALSLLSADILRSALILYVHVSPGESRRRNRERAIPSPDGSVMAHSVPEAVMSAYYGTDDMPWLLDHAERPGTVTVHAHGAAFHVPVAVFDNERPSAALQHANRDAELDVAMAADLRAAFATVVESPRAQPAD